MEGADPGAGDAAYVDRAIAVLDTLQAFFIDMPRGSSFCERSDFQRGYDTVRKATRDGSQLTGRTLLAAIAEEPRAWLVIRCIVGVSPGEAAYIAAEQASGAGYRLIVTQEEIRDIDARAKRGERLLFDKPPRGRKQLRYDQLLRELVPWLAEAIRYPAPELPADRVHRFDKIDTTGGRVTIARAFAADSVPYSELLYERLLGRPYVSHRDSVSRIVGRLVEQAVEQLLERHHIEGRATRSREKIQGFPQAPDFLVPSDAPKTKVIIEAKLTEDDGTARDKVARVQTLRQYENERPVAKRRTIIAVIDGRGFGHRLADLNRLLDACEGHVYTLEELDELVADNGPLRPYVGTSAS